MNAIERMQSRLRGRFPDLTFDLDVPKDSLGPWFLTVFRNNDSDSKLRPIIAEWRPGRGFGLSTPSPEDFGSGPDEVYPTERIATIRFAALLESGENTDPERPMNLSDLRISRWMTQSDLATVLGLDQANVSRIENSRFAHVQLLTLANVIRAMGGEIEIRANFPDRPSRCLTFPTGTKGKVSLPVSVEK